MDLFKRNIMNKIEIKFKKNRSTRHKELKMIL